MNLLLLFLLGLITYFIVQRLSSITRTPTWLLWLVVMTPAFIWNGWVLVKGSEKPPPELFLIPFVVCLMLYWILIQWGRISPPPPVNSSASQESGQVGTNTAETPIDPPVPRPIDKTEEAGLQNCFPWSVYYLQNIEYRPQAVICKGQLRSKPEVAYQTIQGNIEERFGDRFYVVFQEGLNDKPFFVLVPNPRSQSASSKDPYSVSKVDGHGPSGAGRKGTKQTKERVARPFLAIGLLIATFFTTLMAWSELTTDKSFQFSWSNLASGLPYALALMAILGVHEMGHYLTARRYKIQTTLPYFIPVIPIQIFPYGTFGAFIQIRSPIPNRKALFDVGSAGPLSGFVVALPLLLWGLANSDVVPQPQKPEMFNFQALDPSFSLLLALLSKLALGGELTPESVIKLHPVAVASCLGLVVTAINLMPVGQLDGGHIVHAMFGQRTGAAIGQVSRLLLLLLSFAQPHLMPWAIFLFLMPAVDEPALNDVTELDNRRDLWGLLALALLLLIILPTPPMITNWLNI
ncbi:site-2 protease family protein [Kovacikia minuta CCNUW1]|uniref:site-2 protease family protein n=1 Tax=Kovacikia minuta TaxID=2931930 RepID=UPI001CCE6AB9|nr:site-2 protease family protein [Kovacikia minuta]UBF28998.1 site-2 protease family protein [Kovacikia minuta CCNUW1]